MMEILKILQDPSASWSRKPPASLSVVDAVLAETGLALPSDYLTLLRFSNGGEGELSVEPGWFMLWSVEEVVDLNRSYHVSEWLPGYFGFGSNGGGEMLAFDTRSWRIVMSPFIGGCEEDAWFVADDFARFIKAMGRPMPED